MKSLRVKGVEELKRLKGLKEKRVSLPGTIGVCVSGSIVLVLVVEEVVNRSARKVLPRVLLDSAA